MPEFDEVKDSGERQSFDTGSVRDIQVGKGRFDLMPAYALYRLARHYENGAVKYNPRNWELGQPLSRYLDSALRHLNKVLMGLEDEDHLSAAAWNILGIIETKKRIELGILSKDLDDLPTIYRDHFDGVFEVTTEEKDGPPPST
tara:strand:- start:2395 stop:2826 length:432 start_codon:yes stop_codon:yes gene_type:complete